MKRWLLFPSVSLSLFASPVSAARWVTVSRPFAIQKVSIDRDSITQQGKVMTFWAKVTEPLQPVPQQTVDATGMPVNAPPAPLNTDGTAYQMQMSCSSRTVRISSMTAIVNGQSNPFGPTNSSPYTFQPLGGAVGYALYGSVCWENPALGLAAPPPVVPEQDPTPRRTIIPVPNPWPLK